MTKTNKTKNKGFGNKKYSKHKPQLRQHLLLREYNCNCCVFLVLFKHTLRRLHNKVQPFAIFSVETHLYILPIIFAYLFFVLSKIHLVINISGKTFVITCLFKTKIWNILHVFKFLCIKTVITCNCNILKGIM